MKESDLNIMTTEPTSLATRLREVEDQRTINQSNSPEQINSKRVSLLKKAGFVLVGLAFAGGIYLASQDEQNNSLEVQAQKIEQEFFHQAMNNELTVLPKTVILNGGVKIRSTPAEYIYNQDSANNKSGVDNVLYSVEGDKIVVVVDPVIFKDPYGDEWYGFKFAKESKDKKEKEEWSFVKKKSEEQELALRQGYEIINELHSSKATFEEVEPKYFGAIINENGGISHIVSINGNQVYAQSATYPADRIGEIKERIEQGE